MLYARVTTGFDVEKTFITMQGYNILSHLEDEIVAKGQTL